jgi:hypothetical protein
MPTSNTESTALPNVRNAGIRPAWNQMAAVVSMPFPLESCLRRSCPALFQSPFYFVAPDALVAPVIGFS